MPGHSAPGPGRQAEAAARRVAADGRGGRPVGCGVADLEQRGGTGGDGDLDRAAGRAAACRTPAPRGPQRAFARDLDGGGRAPSCRAAASSRRSAVRSAGSHRPMGSVLSRSGRGRDAQVARSVPPCPRRTIRCTDAPDRGLGVPRRRRTRWRPAEAASAGDRPAGCSPDESVTDLDPRGIGLGCWAQLATAHRSDVTVTGGCTSAGRDENRRTTSATVADEDPGEDDRAVGDGALAVGGAQPGLEPDEGA